MAGSKMASYSSNSSSQTLYKVSCITTPPDYETNNILGNLALLKIRPCFQYKDTIQKIDLMPRNEMNTSCEWYYAYVGDCYLLKSYCIQLCYNDCSSNVFIRYATDQAIFDKLAINLGAPLVITDEKGHKMLKGILVQVKKCDGKNGKNRKMALKFLNIGKKSLNKWISLTLNLTENKNVESSHRLK